MTPTPRALPSALLVTVAVLAVACGGSTGATPRPAATPTGHTASPSPTAAAQAAGNAGVCRALEHHANFNTIAQTNAYLRFLGNEMVKPRVSLRLSGAIEALRADLLGFMNGVAAKATVFGDARKLQGGCSSYGVSG